MKIANIFIAVTCSAKSALKSYFSKNVSQWHSLRLPGEFVIACILVDTFFVGDFLPLLVDIFLYIFFLFLGQTIRVPWKEDSARGSVQKFQVNPVNDLVAFQGKYGQIHLMSSRSRSKLFTLKMNDEVLIFS